MNGFLILSFLKFKNGSDNKRKNGAIFSMFKPIRNEERVVAMLLPSTIPMLWLNDNNLAFIRAIVNMISAELDWRMVVEINPVRNEDDKEDVIVPSLFLILFIDSVTRFFDIESRE